LAVKEFEMAMDKANSLLWVLEIEAPSASSNGLKPSWSRRDHLVSVGAGHAKAVAYRLQPMR